MHTSSSFSHCQRFTSAGPPWLTTLGVLGTLSDSGEGAWDCACTRIVPPCSSSGQKQNEANLLQLDQLAHFSFTTSLLGSHIYAHHHLRYTALADGRNFVALWKIQLWHHSTNGLWLCSYACHWVTTIYSCVDIAFRFHMFKQLNLRAQTRLPFFNKPRALRPAAVRPDRTIQTRQFYLSARDHLLLITVQFLGRCSTLWSILMMWWDYNISLISNSNTIKEKSASFETANGANLLLPRNSRCFITGLQILRRRGQVSGWCTEAMQASEISAQNVYRVS